MFYFFDFYVNYCFEIKLKFFEQYDNTRTDKEQIEIYTEEYIELHRQIIKLFETNKNRRTFK